MPREGKKLVFVCDKATGEEICAAMTAVRTHPPNIYSPRLRWAV